VAKAIQRAQSIQQAEQAQKRKVEQKKKEHELVAKMTPEAQRKVTLITLD
jgi:hypothetical protein